MSGIASLFIPTAQPDSTPVVTVPTVDPAPQEDPAQREAARKKREQALAAYQTRRVKTDLTGGSGDTSAPGVLRKTLG